MKKNPNPTFKDFLNVNQAVIQLKRMNIVITEHGDVAHKFHDHLDMGYAYKAMIADLKENKPFFTGPSVKQICTIALAEYQEECNRYIDQEEIDFVNDFFEFEKPITYEEVQAFNSKYI